MEEIDKWDQILGVRHDSQEKATAIRTWNIYLLIGVNIDSQCTIADRGI
jgi:hypothetical protein